jgi:8-oxo-dGTP pyrophosphatase MutT (NUDIX family)
VDEGNCWDPVGGGIEEGEAIEEGFKREVKEEAGIEVTDIKLIQAYTIDTGGLQLIVTAKVLSESVVLSPEHNAFKWITFEELKTITPVSLHLKAIQYMLKNNVEIARYEDYK